ncbi:MAG: glycosyltransferase family 9 protein [Flavobacteriales bacterium]
MAEKLKILIIRYSSIGDIILTTPIIRCLKQQLNADIDFLTKKSFASLLVSNPYINNIHTLNDVNKKLIQVLQSNNYDHVVDLQNNLRSLKIRTALKVNNHVYFKSNFKRHLLINFGVDLLKNHVVDRYFNTIKKLNVVNDNKGIDYFINGSPNVEFNTKQEYITWCIGGTHEHKKLSCTQITEVISKLNLPILLIGGPEDKKIGSEIMKKANSDHVYNFCGKTSFEESAYLIKESKLVLSNDTGMMHIASAFDSPIISFWGCTKPSLGFAPYMPKKPSKNIITPISNKPCSKHGKYCRENSKGCIKKISSELIYNTAINLLK